LKFSKFPHDIVPILNHEIAKKCWGRFLSLLKVSKIDEEFHCLVVALRLLGGGEALDLGPQHNLCERKMQVRFSYLLKVTIQGRHYP
jgi:hypothetical protein